MPTDFESDAKKTIDLSVQAEKMTVDILKGAISEFFDGKAEKKGRMAYKQLENKCKSKLESIEVTENNIGSFLSTAKKYDLDFALKRDKSTNPPTYHVFISANNNESFDKAFAEYAGKMQNQIKNRGEMSINALKREAKKIAKQPRKKEKVRKKTKQMSH